MKNKIIIFLLIIFALGFGLRMAYLSDLMAGKVFPVLEGSDSSAYYSWGKDIAYGDLVGCRAFMKWPLYAYCLGGWLKVFGINLASVFYLQFFLGALNCVLVFFIARKFFNTAVSCIAAFLCLSYGLFVFYDGLIMYTNLSLFLNSLFFLYLLKVKDNPVGRRMFFCGIFLGICAITQASVLLFGVCAVIWILFQAEAQKGLLIKRFLIFLFGLSIIVGVTTLRNYLAEKDFVPIAGNLGFNFYSGNNPQSAGTFFFPSNITPNQEDMFRDSRIIAEAVSNRQLKTSQVSAFWLNKTIEYARNQPVEFILKFFKKFLLVFDSKEYVHDVEYGLISLKSGVLNIMLKDLKVIMPFAFIGLFLGIKNFKKNSLLYLYIATFAFSISIFFVTARYRLMLAPVFMIFAAVGIEKFIDFFRQRQWRGLKFLAVIWIAVFAVLNYSRIFALPARQGENSPLFEALMVNALNYENNAQYSDAISELEQAHQLEPYNRRAISRKALVYFKLGKLDAAVKGYQEVLKISPLSFGAYYNLGLIYNQQMRFKEAQEMLLRAVSFDPIDYRSHFELGMAYAATNDKLKAKEEFNLALKYINRWRKVDIEMIKKEIAALE